ncbi:MAG: FmdB family zinc ribbon protein [Phycisphaerales bacterium]
MAIYEYRCKQHGVFEITRPLGTAPASAPCSACGSEARRVISLPMVISGRRSAWSAAIEHAEKSRYEPEVVTSVPASGARRRTPVLPLTPVLQRLPRP